MTKAITHLSNVNAGDDVATYGVLPVAAGGTGRTDDQITQTITDGDTTHAPSGDAVFDALALKAPKASPEFTGMVRLPDSSVFPRTTGITGASPDSNGVLAVIPSGISNVGNVECWDRADTANGVRMWMGMNSGVAFLNVDALGTSSPVAMQFQMAGVSKGRLTAAGLWEFDTQVTHKADTLHSSYGLSKFLTGNASGRIHHKYYDPHDTFTISANYERTGAATGVIDSTALGTAEVAVMGYNGASGQVILRAGGVNTAPTDRLAVNNVGIGFNGTAPVAKPTVTGSRGGNAALASLLTALANMGLITDSTTA